MVAALGEPVIERGGRNAHLGRRAGPAGEHLQLNLPVRRSENPVGATLPDCKSSAPQEIGREDWPHDEWLLAESFIPGRELTCGVMGDKAMDIIDIRPATGLFYDYDAKYAEGGSIHVIPAELKPNIYRDIQQFALTAHQALGCRGVSRADFRYDDTPHGTGAVVCLEVNTQPGMTRTSLVPEMAAKLGLSFGELVKWMVEDASCDR